MIPVKALLVECDCGEQFTVPITILESHPATKSTITITLTPADSTEGSEIDRYLRHDCSPMVGGIDDDTTMTTGDGEHSEGNPGTHP
jgi:hypothetical protein